MLIQPSKPTPASSSKDRVVVVQPAADDAVPQPLRVANRVLLAAQVFDRSFNQIAVAGVHGDDAVLHSSQQFERIVAGQKRVAGIVVDAKVRRVDARDQVAKCVHLLGELGMLPVVVLVVVLQDERDATARPRAAGMR